MNPLSRISSTIISGFVLAIVISLVLSDTGAMSISALIIWLHVLAGIIWIGLLYYFNFVQTQAVAKALNAGLSLDAINIYVAPLALAWFRYAALLTWLSGAAGIEIIYGPGSLLRVFALQQEVVLGVGAWLGTIMLLNVWLLIWPNQKKILGLHGAIADTAEKMAAKKVAFTASRINTLLSVPMILCMIGGGMGHGLPI